MILSIFIHTFYGNIVNTGVIINRILSIRSYRIIFFAITFSFALLYMFVTGIIFYSLISLPDFVPVPYFRIIWTGDIIQDQSPWIIAYINQHFIFRMSLHALVSTALLSLLVGFNSSLIIYLLRKEKEKEKERQENNSINHNNSNRVGIHRRNQVSRSRSSNNRKYLNSRSNRRYAMLLTSIVPASFTTFACHSAIILPLLGFSIFSIYGTLFVTASILILSSQLVLISNKIKNTGYFTESGFYSITMIENNSQQQE